MKMKEVCEKTGLTDRAVRLYVEEKLLEPEIIKGYMGRRALNFRQENVEQLLDIALLRSFGFSIEQIRTIQTNPEGTGVVLEHARRQRQEAADANRKILDALNMVKVDSGCGMAELAQRLRKTQTGVHQPVEQQTQSSGWRYVGMFLKVCLLCVGFLTGVLAVLLLIDMAVFYFANGAITLTADGLAAVFERSGAYYRMLLTVIILAVPMSYYIAMIWRYGRNSRKPEITIRAVVVDKKQNADAVVLSSFYARTGGMIGMLVFRTSEGELLELTVPQQTYYRTDIGTWGELTYQGSKMLHFAADV